MTFVKTICIIVWAALLISFSVGSDPHCVMSGFCATDQKTGGRVPCIYNGSAKPLTDESHLEKLRLLCPYYVNVSETGNLSSSVCCSSEQVDDLFGDITGVPRQMLYRCPSCYNNFVHTFCAFTCSPRQSEFMTVTNSALNTTTKQKYVTEVEVAFSDKFAMGLFNSCRDVMMPSGNDRALSVMCGTTADKCTIEQWLYFTGSRDNDHTPMQINFCIPERPQQAIYNCSHHNDTPLIPMHEDAYRCDQSMRNPDPSAGGAMLPACSCQDCRDSCPILQTSAPEPGPWHILGLDGYAFIMFFVFLLLTSALITFELTRHFWPCSSRCPWALSEPEASADHHRRDSYSSQSQRTCSGLCKAYEKFRDLWDNIGAHIEVYLQLICTRWGTFCARHAILVVCIPLVVSVGLSACVPLVEVTTNPVELWCPPDSEVRHQKDYYDHNFDPFLRNEQIIVRHKTGGYWLHANTGSSTGYTAYPLVYELSFLDDLFTLQEKILALEAWEPSLNMTVRLGDICMKPLAPDNNFCADMTPFGYFQNNRSQLHQVKYDDTGFFPQADYIDHFTACLNNPASPFDMTPLDMPCLSDFGGAVFPYTAFGGFPVTKIPGTDIAINEYMNSTSLIITIVINNSPDPDSKQMKMAMAWEAEYIKFMKNFSHPNMTISWNSERSIEDELDRQSRSDVLTILISYLVMFAYVALTLGHVRRLRTLFVDVKIMLGLAGVLIVLASVTSSIGLMALVRFPMTLIIVEVIPFLVLAIGVDNIFILVQAYQRSQRIAEEPLEEHIGRVLGSVGPSMILTATSESIAFFLGSMTSMPAVQMFSVYAGMAVVFNTLLQFTVFLGLFTLDSRRQTASRVDLVCCVRVDACDDEGDERQSLLRSPDERPAFNPSPSYAGMPVSTTKSNPRIGTPTPRKAETSTQHANGEGFLYRFVRDYYSPFILHPIIKPIVVFIFIAWLCTAITFVPHMSVGLNQMLAMPQDSYVLDYFYAETEFLAVGPPGYMVVMDGYDYTTKRGQEMVCAAAGCPPNSLLGQVYSASTNPSKTRIATSAASWIDDYIDWLQPSGAPQCCRQHANESFCPATDAKSKDCVPCKVHWNESRPSPHDFLYYLPMYLNDNPGDQCAKGGHAAYGQAVKLVNDSSSPSGYRVGATQFMFYHTITRTSSDFITSYKSALDISNNVTRTLREAFPGSNYTVFPYSIFYVFYDQYLHIVDDAVMNLLVCLAAVCVVSIVLTGLQVVSALWITANCASILLSMLAYMSLLEIELNALSLVNLVVSIGISVEFGAHLIRAFSRASDRDPLASHSEEHKDPAGLSRSERARLSLVHMGSSVLSGITLTKIGGVTVLAFAKSQLFQVYYFQVYAAIILFGAFHGLLVLPVLLSYFGPGVRVQRQRAIVNAQQKLGLITSSVYAPID